MARSNMTVERPAWAAKGCANATETPWVPTSAAREETFASFIVCTRNRVEALDACIRSIEAACRSHATVRCELVVVDNGSTDGTPDRISRIAAASPMAITHAVETRPGLAVARNTAMAHARGRILIFIDDDCEVDVGYLRDLEHHCAGGGGGVIRGGRVELGNPADLPFTIKRSNVRERLTHEVHPGGFVLGCNMTMHREVALRVGPFDEWFGAGAPLLSAEDTDYLVRADRLGIPVEYVPDMVVFHHHGRRARAAIETLHCNYSFGNGALCLKHLRTAPWLLRHFCWTVRSAFGEIFGGARFDPVLHLSHWPIVFMNLLGALKFVGLFVAERSPGPAEQRAEEQLHR